MTRVPSGRFRGHLNNTSEQHPRPEIQRIQFGGAVSLRWSFADPGKAVPKAVQTGRAVPLAAGFAATANYVTHPKTALTQRIQ